MSDWSSDGCSSDREPASSVRRDLRQEWRQSDGPYPGCECKEAPRRHQSGGCTGYWACGGTEGHRIYRSRLPLLPSAGALLAGKGGGGEAGPEARLFRSEEHTSELQSLMRISYAVFCLKKKKTKNIKLKTTTSKENILNAQTIQH